MNDSPQNSPQYKKSAPAAIRTRDLRLRRPVLYPAELQAPEDLNCINVSLPGGKITQNRP